MTLDFLFGLAPFVVMGLAFCAWFLSYRLEVQRVSAMRGCELNLAHINGNIAQMGQWFAGIASELKKGDKK